jgi:hypothetical protein
LKGSKATEEILVKFLENKTENLFLLFHFWHNVPEDNNKIVFNNGIAKGSKGVIPCGGQTPPISIVGDKLE